MIQRIDVDGTPQGTPATTGSENGSGSGSFSSSTGLLEGCGDGGDPGAGDKLLDLLRKWDIQNVVLCVTNWDDGLRGRLGSGRYRLYLNSAKDVLEKCYLDSVSTAASTEATDDDDQGRSTHSSILSGSSKNSSDMDSRASDFDSNKSSSVVRIPSPGRLSGGIASRADLDNIVEMGRTKMPRGIDLHRMYRRARARFMPVREEYQHIKKSFVVSRQVVLQKEQQGHYSTTTKVIFALNCGGGHHIAPDGVEYEPDDLYIVAVGAEDVSIATTKQTVRGAGDVDEDEDDFVNEKHHLSSVLYCS
jgi:hypothetical protein